MLGNKFSHGFEIRMDEKTVLNENENPRFHYVHYVRRPPIHTFSFKGGGVRVFVYETFVRIAYENGLLGKIRQVSGSSSGVLAALVCSIHFVREEDRHLMFHSIFKVPVMDLFDDSPMGKKYEKISSLISQPFWAASDAINRSAIKLRIFGFPLQLSALLLKIAGAIVSARGIVGLYNLYMHKGIYRSHTLQNHIRDQLKHYVQLGVDDILNKITDPVMHGQCIQHLSAIGLGKIQDNGFIVSQEISFFHFKELSRLPGSQFKELIMTAVKLKKEEGDGKISLEELKKRKLISFSADNPDSRDFPVYKAFSIAIAFPRVYQPGVFNGEEYTDGGVLDNSPGRLAAVQGVSPVQARYGATDNLARLQVRVEYPDDLKNLLWKKPYFSGGSGRMIEKIINTATQWFSYGIDSLAAEENSIQSIQTDSAQMTLQMDDFGIPRFADLTDEQRHEFLKKSGERVKDYFENHRDEVAHIKHYRRPVADESSIQKFPVHAPQVMPLNLQVDLLAMLENRQDFPTNEIFYIAGTESVHMVFSADQLAVLERIRDQEIMRIRDLPDVRSVLGSMGSELALSTSVIVSRLRDYNPSGSHAVLQAHDILFEEEQEEKSVEAIIPDRSSVPCWGSTNNLRRRLTID